MRIDFYKKEANEYLKQRKAECSHIEYKASENQLDKILKTICAYANNYYDNEFSFIFLGVEEVNNENEKAIPSLPIKGIEESHLEKAKNTINSLKPYIYPNVKFNVLTNELDGRYYLLIVVEKQNQGPYAISERVLQDKKIPSLKPGRYVRIESDSRIAKINEEYDLLRKFSNYHFSSDVSENSTLDDLDYDYMREYLKITSKRDLSDNLTKREIANTLKLFAKNETASTRVTNFAILMFSKRPDDIIPYSYIEIITDTLGSKSRMEAKDFKGPIWKQYYMALKYIDDNFIRTITLREDDDAINKKINNYPFKAVEELLANAIVHKNYEEGKTIQVYITNEEINIINYNKPLPPITLKDLNTRTIFMERDSVNPEIRDMFKDLGIIESYGTGVGEAKRACQANGNDPIFYKLFDDDANITSVVIPCNKKYYELLGKNLGTGDKNMGTGDRKLETESLIINSKYNKNTKNNLDKIFFAYSESLFSPKEIMQLLDVSKNTATSYINKLLNLDVLVKVKGIGQSKYRFKNKLQISQ